MIEIKDFQVITILKVRILDFFAEEDKSKFVDYSGKDFNHEFLDVVYFPDHILDLLGRYTISDKTDEIFCNISEEEFNGVDYKIGLFRRVITFPFDICSVWNGRNPHLSSCLVVADTVDEIENDVSVLLDIDNPELGVLLRMMS